MLADMSGHSDNPAGGRAAAHGLAALWCDAPVRWLKSERPVPYEAAMARMDALAAQVAAGAAAECAWLLEHPALITAGTSARPEDLLNPRALPVYRSGRGGQYTWHGPGQRVVYLMLDLRARGRDVRAYVVALEQWIIDTLADFGVRAWRDDELVGVWTRTANGDMAKIAAIGVRVSRGVTRHGVALNVCPDLSWAHEVIVPCGVREHGVTSLHALGLTQVSMAEVDAALKRHFTRLFGPVREENMEPLQGQASTKA